MNNVPPLLCKLSTPKVVWSQTDAKIVMRVMLPGVDSYFLRFDEDHVRFSTVLGEQKYYLCIYLFGAVIPEKCVHMNRGREIVVHIPKAHKWVPWPRLAIDKRKNPQIIFDLDNMKDDEEPSLNTDKYKEYRREYMQKNGISSILPDAKLCSDDESDDEEIDDLWD